MGWRETGNRKRDDNTHRGFRTGLEPELLTCCGSNNSDHLQETISTQGSFKLSTHFMFFISSWSSVAVGYSWKKQLADLEFRLFCQRTAVFEPSKLKVHLLAFNSTFNNSLSWSSSAYRACNAVNSSQTSSLLDLELGSFRQINKNWVDFSGAQKLNPPLKTVSCSWKLQKSGISEPLVHVGSGWTSYWEKIWPSYRRQNLRV